MMSPKVAILGAGSHIAKNLILSFLRRGMLDLHLFTRSRDQVASFIAEAWKDGEDAIQIYDGYSDFGDHSYDIVINCVGVGTLNKIGSDFNLYFTVSEEFDNLVINYLLKRCSSALYICFSSGSIYGSKHSGPANKDSCNCIPVNNVKREDYYLITRLYSEAKHRSLEALKIADLRVFSFFSRFIDLSDGYFMTEVVRSFLQKREFITNNQDFVRDYVHPEDLFEMIIKCWYKGGVNTAFDVVSGGPVTKWEILKALSSKFGLKYVIDDSISFVSATGNKNYYYSTNNAATEIGYSPAFSSLDTIVSEAGEMVSTNLRHRRS